MSQTIEPVSRDAVVVDQAGAIVMAAVRQATERARTAAERCGCATCRAYAAQTCQWAITILQPAAGPISLPRA
ncbi:MAG: hypothetical protein IT340_20710 [Chloroflexi bacterium]|nr:hypothetical protein [Chloroflexota bacterium]